jgi:predicted nucleic acid-binding protein
VAYLFDTDAISEVLKKQPLAAYLGWLGTIPRDRQFCSAVTVGELFKGAYRSSNKERHLKNVTERVLPALTILPYDLNTARIFGKLSATLEQSGAPLVDADLQIAATAVQHELELVTGNLRHFERVPGLKLNRVLAGARNAL